MSKQEFTKLIDELKQLKLRELEIIESIELNLENQQQGQQTPVNNTPNTTPPVARSFFSTAAVERTVFSVGDRIVITNKITRPTNRPLNDGDKFGIVLKVAPKRIDIKTLNGSYTWRVPSNVRLHRTDE
jgi:hypothetical protein